MINYLFYKFRKPAICILLSVAVIAAVCGLAACNLNGYTPKTDIPGINNNAVLNIENNQISFALGMKPDLDEVVVNCGLVLTDDEGHEVRVTKKNVTDGAITYTSFDINTVGVNKQVTVAYKNAINYIFYDVTEYTVELYTDGSTQWKNEQTNARLDAENTLSVTINLNNYNYSTDSTARSSDSYRAERFCGWYTESGAAATGNYNIAPESKERSVLKLYARYLTDAQFNDLKLSYDSQGRRVFSGYTGERCNEVTVPEGVTYVDMFAIFKDTPSVTSINFIGLSVPSTARLDLPLVAGINSRGLGYVSVDAGNPDYSSFDGAVYSKNYHTLYFMPADCSPYDFPEQVNTFDTFACAYWRTKKFTLPDSVKTINDYCFAYSALDEVIGIEHVETVKRGVFVGSGVSVTDNGGSYFTNSDGKYILSRVDAGLESFKVKDGTVAIAANAFADCTLLKSVDLGTELKEIGEYAFSSCTSLESITLPLTVVSIGNYAFYKCTSLVSVENLQNVTFSTEKGSEYDVPAHLFDGCTNLPAVTLPDKVNKLGSYSFARCPALTGLDLKNVTEIDGYAFYQSGLSSIVLPASLKTLGNSVFANCKLETVDFSLCKEITEIPARCFQQCSLTSVTIPEHITVLCEYAFYYITTLTEVTLTKVETIEQYAFGNCTKLSKFDYGTEVTVIGKRAFSGTAFTEVVIPDSVEEVHGYAYVCSNLRTLTIGAKVSVFGDYTYGEDGENFATTDLVLFTANNLEEIIVSPENPNFEIVNGALYGKSVCGKDYGARGVLYFMPPKISGYTSFTDDPATKIILPYAFQGQSSLTEVTFSEGIENIGKVVFYSSTSLEKLNIASSISCIGINLLLDCTNDVEVVLDENDKINFENDVMYSGTTALLANSASGELHLREDTTLIAAGTFMNNTKITKVYIPDSVTQIDDRAFAGCTNLELISIGAGLTELNGTPFQRLASLTRIEVSEKNTAFRVVDDMLLTLDGKTLILCAAANGMTDLSKMPDTVETIGAYAFSDHKTLKTLKLPENVKVIGNYAFYECRSLELFYASEALEEIGEYAFSFKNSINPSDKTETRHCNVLKTVLIHENLKSLGRYAFYGQYGIEDVYYDMTEAQIKAFWSNAAIATTNSSYLHYGCHKSGDEYYNYVKSYLYSRIKPEITVAGYGWFTFDEEGNPVKW